MAEEASVKKEEIQVPPQTPPETSKPDFTEKAMGMGWRPESEWDGDPEDWVDAKEFIGRQKLYDRISDANKKVKTFEKTLNEFKQHYDNVSKTEYERALQTLKLQRIKALEEGDSTTLLKVEDQIDEVKDKIKEAKQTTATTTIDPDFQRDFEAWTGRNSWYQSDPALRKEADTLGYAYVAMHGNSTPPDEVLKYIEKEIKYRHASKFSNPNRGLPNMVENGDGDTKKKPVSRQNDIQLSEDEERAMKKFVKLGVMTEAKYKEDLKKMRE